MAVALFGFSVQVEYPLANPRQDLQSWLPKDCCLVCIACPDLQSEQMQEFQRAQEPETSMGFVVVFVSESYYKRVFMVMQAIFLEIILILS